MASRVEVSFADATTTSRDYEVLIADGILDELGTRVADVCRVHRYVVISDSRVAELYGDRVLLALRSAGLQADLLSFPEGEANKTRESWSLLSDQMLEMGVGRDAAVIALGGGVTGDLAGFVAATYLRGLPLIQVPTSLLAMIDSSVGGKTGVDTVAGKNLIGAFLQPGRVFADVQTLQTLEPRHLRAGFAEAIKHGAIMDTEYFEWILTTREQLLSLNGDEIGELIQRSVQIKADVVAADEREGGLRKALNFGHTAGHAIEAASAFDLLHGEAISIGMVVEARIGEAIGVTEAGTAERLASAVESFGLPSTIPRHLEPSRILELTRTDKKARDGQVEYALVEQIGTISRGDGKYGVRVDEGAVLAAVETCLSKP